MSTSSDTSERDKRKIKPPKGPPYSVYGFPQIISTHAATRKNSVEIYTRALLLEGHGYPVFYPFGKLNPRDLSVLKPITIGDVGLVNSNGNFRWLFNIFLPGDRPTQVSAPNGFHPFEPAPAESDIIFTPNYHTPGTVVTSPGVEVNIRSKEPWDIKFTSNENQAGMLILQGGADRYDLISSERYHEYIAKHAQHWYQIANDFGEATFPNGSLLVVTGYDSCSRFSHTQYAPESPQLVMDMAFVQKLGTTPGRWLNRGNNQTVGWPYPPNSNLKAVDGPLTVFLRGIRVSLNGRIWRSIIPSTGFFPNNLHCTLVASTPSKTQLWLEKTKVRLRIGQTEEEMLRGFLSLHASTFQPNYILGQILLGQFPQASVALIEDKIWSSFTEKGHPCTLPEINKLISRTLSACDVVEYQGTLKLIPRNKDPPRQCVAGETILTPPPSWTRRQPDDSWVRDIPLAKYPWL